ncbi:hypothetical protein JB92DRAFT_2825680 [Gautieria morchelliformis]|nr:hypothetical protein JB92DRAFT_2825680 [Gautieria morchelliformis]
MLQHSQTLVALKQVVLRGVARHNEVYKADQGRSAHRRTEEASLPSAPWLVLDPKLRSFREPSDWRIPTITDYDRAEKAGRRSNIEREHKDIIERDTPLQQETYPGYVS